jgi:Cu(I)/Ag(I) efflux system protein CusF
MKAPLATLMVSLTLAVPAFAQQKPDDHSAHHPPAGAALAAGAADVAEGEVRKVDKDAAKLTLKHGEIKNLDMPAMTMIFHVRDKAMLDPLKAGDKVRFKAINESGKYTVTEIQVLK